MNSMDIQNSPKAADSELEQAINSIDSEIIQDSPKAADSELKQCAIIVEPKDLPPDKRNKAIVITYCNAVISYPEPTTKPDKFLEDLYRTALTKFLDEEMHKEDKMTIRDWSFDTFIRICEILQPLFESRFGSMSFIEAPHMKDFWGKKYKRNIIELFGLLIVLHKLGPKFKPLGFNPDVLSVKICDCVVGYNPICIVCKSNNVLKSSYCGLKYCSDACQIQNWSSHKKTCKFCLTEAKRVKSLKKEHNCEDENANV